MTRDILGPFEYQVLQILQLHPSEAYGVKIAEWMRDRTGAQPALGALYTTLDRLAQKGYVKSHWGEKTPERGGRRKRYYQIEAAGIFALQRTRARMRAFEPNATTLGGLTPSEA